jgi:ketosteroid isomerase-like protein
MVERAAILQTIDDVYAARARGDEAALEAFWAPAVEFRLVGDAGLLP